MSQRTRRVSWTAAALGLIGIAGAWLSIGLAQQEAESLSAEVPPEQLLPAGTVLYVERDGLAGHEEAWQRTAAHEALSETGLVEIGNRIVRFLAQRTTGEADPKIHALLRHVSRHGFSFSVALAPKDQPPLPRMTLVLHEGASHEEPLAELVQTIAGRRTLAELKTHGRSIRMAAVPQTPGVQVGLWAEGGHLVLVAGLGAVQPAAAVAAGEAPNITSNGFWQRHRDAKVDFEVATTGWLDAATLRKRVAPLRFPFRGKTVAAGKLLHALGLDAVEAVVYRSGYEGRSLRSTTELRTQGELRGLLALTKSQPFGFDDLPPLPVGTTGFYARGINLTGLFDDLTQLARDLAALRSPEGPKRVDDGLQTFREQAGFDPRDDLLDALGEIVCVYADPDQGFLGTGSALAIRVRDAEALRRTLNQAFARLDEVAEENFRVHRAERAGREVLTFELGRRVHAGALAVDDDWLVAGFLPQPVEAFFLRADGKLPRWSPEQLRREGVTGLPETFTAIAVNDPRVSYRSALKLAPVLLTAGVSFLKAARILPLEAELPVTAVDIPPAEQVAAPLFPNVTTGEATEAGVRWTSRDSVPVIPVVSGIGSGNTTVAGSLLAATVLPAVGQAREAARRSQSRNHLKQFGLAMHNYHDVHDSFPAGTFPNEKLEPDERLSWIVSLLPFLDQAGLYDKIDLEGGWKDEANRKYTKKRLEILTNPGREAEADMEKSEAEYGPTHYVGIAGVGEDAPGLPVDHKRAGVFGDNRKTEISDIRDGTSNTMMISEAAGEAGPWAAGGKPTLRALTKKPYINGPDGIGGPFEGGCNVLFADGSVRFISENIDPEVFEGMSTINGGEVLNVD